ncbi:hypothetical protein BsWGS_21407 [Bradybaena similaris]
MDVDSDEDDIWNYKPKFAGNEKLQTSKVRKQETISSEIPVKRRKKVNADTKRACTTKKWSTTKGQQEQGKIDTDTSADVENKRGVEECLDVDTDIELVSVYLPQDKSEKNDYNIKDGSKKSVVNSALMNAGQTSKHDSKSVVHIPFTSAASGRKVGHSPQPSHKTCSTSKTMRPRKSSLTSGKCTPVQSPGIKNYFSPSNEKRNKSTASSKHVKNLLEDFNDDEVLFLREERSADMQMKLGEDLTSNYVCSVGIATLDCSVKSDNREQFSKSTQEKVHCKDEKDSNIMTAKERVNSTDTTSTECHAGKFNGDTSNLAATLKFGHNIPVDKSQHCLNNSCDKLTDSLKTSNDKLTDSEFVTSGGGFVIYSGDCDIEGNIGDGKFRDTCELQTSSSSGEIVDDELTAVTECNGQSALPDVPGLMKSNSLLNADIAQAAAVEDKIVMKKTQSVRSQAQSPSSANNKSDLSSVCKQTSLFSFFKARVGSSCKTTGSTNNKFSALSDVTHKQASRGRRSNNSVGPSLKKSQTLPVATPIKGYNSSMQHVNEPASYAADEREPQIEQGGQQQNGRGKRQCPFYKKIHNTGITVDAFSYGVVPGCQAYFLTHFHYDHYGGLTKKFAQPIFCSQVTGNLVEHRLGVDKKWINRLQLWKPYQVSGVTLTLMEANHCPGAVMVLFELKDGRTVLHTGDFRACPEMEKYPILKRAATTDLYLDTTYCNPSYSFPTQQDVINFVVSLVLTYVTSNPNTLVVCGTYTIGKEKIFKAVAETLNSKICVTRDKKKVLDCLDDTELQARLTLDWSQGQVHVLPMGKLNQKALFEHHASHPKFKSVLALEPTGWSHSNGVSLENLCPKWSRNNVTLYGIPYSEHSSFQELKRFVQFLRPKKIIPTVNNGSPAARKKMEDIFSSWTRENLPSHGALPATSRGF